MDQSTVTLYEQYNQPYRPIVRHCDHCEEEIQVAEKPIEDLEKREG